MHIAEALTLFAAGAVASGVNAVAGGGSLISFPALTLGLGIAERTANATNSVGLFPGSFASGLGSSNQLAKTGKFFKLLVVPTILGSMSGALLLLNTSNQSFRIAIPFLILLASILLFLQPKIKNLVTKGDHKVLAPWVGCLLQFLVATYGGYFGAGMGIMMLAAFSLYMEANLHEINAVKNWLGTVINVACSCVFIFKGLVLFPVAAVLAMGGMVGGLLAARWSQKLDADKMRTGIAIYGFAMSAYYAYKAFG